VGRLGGSLQELLHREGKRRICSRPQLPLAAMSLRRRAVTRTPIRILISISEGRIPNRRTG
jgi:hypothetical protein